MQVQTLRQLVHIKEEGSDLEVSALLETISVEILGVNFSRTNTVNLE